MTRRAYHDRRRQVKATDFFKRPTEMPKETTKEDIMQSMEQAQKYLSQFKNFNIPEPVKKGGIDHGDDRRSSS